MGSEGGVDGIHFEGFGGSLVQAHSRLLDFITTVFF